MLIKVKVFPNSKKDELIIKSADAFEVKVKEKPEQGRANKTVVRILSRYFKIGGSGVIMVKGGKRRNEAPRANARGIFSSFGGAKSAEAENWHSSSTLRPRFSAKEDKIFEIRRDGK